MKNYCNLIGEINKAREANGIFNAENIRKAAIENPQTGIYPDSIHIVDGCLLLMAKGCGAGKRFVIAGTGALMDSFESVEHLKGDYEVKVCLLNVANSKAIRRLFPFTNPVSHINKSFTMGLGDRLGVATAGIVRLLKDYDIFPTLAQQSIRELNLTGRTYEEVLSDAVWAVFQENYDKGFGADGDHNKTAEEVQMSLDCGFTMITLDCSEHIDNEAAGLSKEAVEENYLKLPSGDRTMLEEKYMNRKITLKSGAELFFDRTEFMRDCLVYLNAIKFAIGIFNNVIKNCGRKIDFEMSIDETLSPTSPEAHFFVASELLSGGVEIRSLAPRFCGEFQKGIDYRGDIEQFKKEFKLHAEVAEYLGYKLSVHSGSDKFAVFPTVGKETDYRFHLKVAGTNWLEAVRLIAKHNPSLYRRMHRFAVQHLNEAKKYYVIFTEADMVPDVDEISDEKLPDLMNVDESRQALHVTYGLILQAKNPDGEYLFRDELFKTLYDYEEEYYEMLEKHIGRHVNSLLNR
ncbi:MAG: tagaturonate epimerase family protein [Eubacteriales bacterium]|nr:tagaturonate epimerase family protein [Eubacteriales bacterium]